jgi:amino acid transporter
MVFVFQYILLLEIPAAQNLNLFSLEDRRTTKRGYRKSLGLFELVGFGLGGTIDSGIFIVPGISAGIAGPSSIFAWIFACASASSIMYSLAKTSSKYPSTGAFYSIFCLRSLTGLINMYSVSS